MGSDGSPIELFKAVSQAIESFPSITFIVFINPSTLTELIAVKEFEITLRHPSLKFEFCSDFIKTEDDPLAAIRNKKNASLVVAIKQLRKRQIHALISAGNTGALLAAATVYLPLLCAVKRPALLTQLPTENGKTAVVDVGGNVCCKAIHLVQFAQLGAAYQKCQGISSPRIGLLNIGSESKKGTAEVRQAYQLLQDMHRKNELNFIGNIEGRDLFQGVVDVLVTDGFTGNILLKTSEGVSSFIFRQLDKLFKKALTRDLNTLFSSLQAQFDYEEYPGAILCGIEGIIIKCHGQSSHRAFLNGIQGAIVLVENAFIEQIKSRL